MSIIRDLLSIKTFREHKAEMAVVIQRSVLRRATDQRDAAQHQLQDFREWAERHERALFDELCSRTVRLRDIQDVQASVGEMRGQERQYARQAEEAEDLRQQEERELEHCGDVHVEASRVKERFVELARVHAQEQLREFERKEDLEMEEVAEARRDRADWDEYLEEAA